MFVLVSPTLQASNFATRTKGTVVPIHRHEWSIARCNAFIFAQRGQSMDNKVQYPDWETLLRALNNQLDERLTICWDEFPYMVKSCPSLPSVLQKLLNMHVFKFDLILCGSSQQLMYNCVFDKKLPLYGLADEVMKLSQIPARYVMEVFECSAERAVEEYAVWGGIPRYWELRKDYKDCDSAIRGLLLDTQGILAEETQRLLRDDMRDTVQTATLLSIIGNGANKLSEIALRAGKSANEITEPLLSFCCPLCVYIGTWGNRCCYEYC